MSEETAIALESIAKAYRIWRAPQARLTFPLLRVATGWLPEALRPQSVRVAMGAAEGQQSNPYFHDFYALRDISFSIRRGEAVGIVGRNGSGKSTLLQIIAGTLSPTAGSVRVQGRVAALLELGSGFNPEFTGRENALLNGAILGLTRDQILERFDSIAAFADIGEFIDQPVKTYSNGMQLRLAFAVAAHVEPDILIVDEALSVGDARFQLKCARAIDRFVEQGVTFLFVSHDLNSVKRLCSRAILLEHGRIVYQGKPNDVANLYSKLIADGGSVEALHADITTLRERDAQTASAPAHRSLADPAREDRRAGPSSRPGAIRDVDGGDLREENERLLRRIQALELELNATGDSEWKDRVERLASSEGTPPLLPGVEYAYGGELGRINRLAMFDCSGVARGWFTTGETVEVRLEVEALSDLPEPIFAMTIKDLKGQDVYGTNTLYSRQPAPPLAAGDKRLVKFTFPANLGAGQYFLSVGFTQFVGQDLLVVHRRYDAVEFSIHGTDRCFGITNCFARIAVEALPPAP